MRRGVRIERPRQIRLTSIWDRVEETGPTLFSGGTGRRSGLVAPQLFASDEDGKSELDSPQLFSSNEEEDDLTTNDSSAGKIQNESELRSILAAEGKSEGYIERVVQDIKVGGPLRLPIGLISIYQYPPLLGSREIHIQS